MSGLRPASARRPYAALRRLLVAVALAATTLAYPAAQAVVSYRLSFAEREHRLMDVDVTFADVPEGPLQLRMSRTSPGRYALHEFAKNVFDVRITDPEGNRLDVTRPDPHQWDVAGHGGSVRVQYRVFGDRVDGTYLAVDSTHAHIHMPAALMWARGMEGRPVRVRFEPPPGASWRVATQLVPAGDAFTYSAPNLQYLMDSPTEFSAFALRTFSVTDEGRAPVFRVAVHHSGSDAELDGFARGVEEIVREMRHVFREFPAFENNTYTFIADYLPWADGDGMEHRNSTILTSSRAIRDARLDLLDTAAHEFFHAWNVERIRPASLEPFDFEDANMSDELWFGEGFTTYYGGLIMRRAGLRSDADYARDVSPTLDAVLTSPGRQFHSPIEMSRLAPFRDAAVSIDPTNFDNTFISYYTWGAAVALGLDLTLRDRSDGKVTLDDFMRAMWATFGRSAAKTAGFVETPYTIADLEAALASVSGDAAFANDFFSRYIEGRDVVDYAGLLARAGLVLRPAAPGRPFAGEFRLQDAARGARVGPGAVPAGSPAYAAGLERGDIITSIGGATIARAEDVDRALAMRKPGDTVPITFERRGQPVNGVLRLIEDPRVEVVLAEQIGQTLTAVQRQFREAWLSSAAR